MRTDAYLLRATPWTRNGCQELKEVCPPLSPLHAMTLEDCVTAVSPTPACLLPSDKPIDCGQLALRGQYVSPIGGGLPPITPRLIDDAILGEQPETRNPSDSPHKGDRLGRLAQGGRTSACAKDENFALLGQWVFHYNRDR